MLDDDSYSKKMKVYRITWNKDFLAKSGKDAYNQVVDELDSYHDDSSRWAKGKVVKPMPEGMRLTEDMGVVLWWDKDAEKFIRIYDV